MAENTKRQRRRLTLTTVLKQVSRAGQIAKSASIAPDGTVLIEFGKLADAEVTAREANPWDEVLNRGRN